MWKCDIGNAERHVIVCHVLHRSQRATYLIYLLSPVSQLKTYGVPAYELLFEAKYFNWKEKSFRNESKEEEENSILSLFFGVQI